MLQDLNPFFDSLSKIPPLIAVIIPNNQAVALAVDFTALTGIGGRLGIIANADLGA
jgi:hypothetical protein